MSQAEVRRPGMGIAARFTLGLGVVATLFSVVAAVLLLRGLDRLGADLEERARRSLAVETVRLRAEGVTIPPGTPVVESPSPGGVRVQAGELTLPDGQRRVRFYRVLEPGSNEPVAVLFAPEEAGTDVGRRMLVLIVLVSGSMVLATVLVGAWMARRVAAPLRDMVEDVLAISRGRLDHHVIADDAVGEVRHLAVAVDRMVEDLLESRETAEELAASRAEVEHLRELRRNLRPMEVVTPPGWEVESCLLEAEGAGGGDFVDTMTDEEGRLTVVVGSPAAEGMAGALLMAMTRAYLRGAVLTGADPALACDRANTALNRALSRGLYCSVMVLQVDPETGRAALVSAGHDAPAVRHDARAGVWKKVQPNGIALGFDEGPIFRNALETAVLELAPGDAVFLSSPSLARQRRPDGRELGEAGVATLARIALEEGLEAARDRLLAFLGGPPEDDLACTIVKRLA